MKRHCKILIISAIVVVVVASVAFLCAKRWGAWFGNPVEQPFVASDSICRVQLTFGRQGARSRAVSWQCADTLASSEAWLVHATDTQCVHAVAQLHCTAGGQAAYYWADFGELSPGNYTYSVRTGGQVSDWYAFEIAEADSVRFIFVGDVQDTHGALLHEKICEIHQRHQPDFWLFGGDVIERPHDCHWQQYFDMVADIRTSTPLLAVAGNHEYIKGLDKFLEPRFRSVFPYYFSADTTFCSVATFHFDVAGVHFYLLDSNNDVWTLPAERCWLAKALECDSAHWRIAAMHHPVYSIRGKLTNFWVRCAFASLFNEKFDVVLSGHEHAYARRTTDGATPIYIVTQFSPKDYRVNFDDYERFALGERFYQVITVCENLLRISTYTLQHELYDEIILKKNGSQTAVTDRFKQQPEHLVVDSMRYPRSLEKRLKYERAVEARRQLNR